ncbi:MAG: class I adenylate-forming enzyme family protein [Opitutaceae bacterium]
MLACPPPAGGLSWAALQAHAEQAPGQVLWRSLAGEVTWRRWIDRVEEAAAAYRNAGVVAGDVVVTPGESTIDTLVWLFGGVRVGAVVMPLRKEREAEALAWQAFVPLRGWVRDGVLVPVEPRPNPTAEPPLLRTLRATAHPGLILGTGGTTGRPKLVLHDLERLLGSIPVATSRSRSLLPLMRLDHIGGLDMVWRALAGGHTVVEPPLPLSPDALGETISRFRVEVLPATPSLLSMLLVSGAFERHDFSSLRTVPYGAEPMPGPLLERLRGALPHVKFLERFGTSETGALPVATVKGGMRLAGGRAPGQDETPASESGGGFEWKVADGELWVRSPARALGYLTGESGGFQADGWFRTGDLAEWGDDGVVRVLGRKQDLINVGGEKVLPGVVEDVLLTHPHVVDCRVFPQANALLGQVVAVEVVWRGAVGGGALGVKRELHQFAQARLAPHQLPVVVRLVAAIAETQHFKKARPSA